MKREKTPKKKRYTISKKMKTKLTIVFVIVFILLFLLIVRLTWINMKSGEEYKLTVLDQTQTVNKTINYKRGDILDSKGSVLATSIKVYNLVIDPKVILTKEAYLEPTVNAVNECFGIDKNELKTKISENPNSSYIVMKKDLTYEEVEPFEKLEEEDSNIKGIWFEESYKRSYPFSTLCSDVLGFTTKEGDGSTGLEAFYDEYLKGTNGREFTYTNDENAQETVIKKPIDGSSLVTTIDVNVQTIVEKYIKEWKEAYKPQNIGVVIADPQTGAILAMADDKSIDLNNPRDLSAYLTPEEEAACSDEDIVNILNSIWKNFTITEGYEPGSTFKPFTVAASLEENITKISDVFGCDGGQHVADKYIGCHVRSGHGELTLKEVIMQSCNDALMQINEKLGAEKFSKYREKFGFNKYTNIDLPNEASMENIVHQADKMDETDVATYSFGQNFKVTMAQMTTAFSSLINGGYLYQPHVVKEITNADGGVVKTVDSTLVSKTVSAETSSFIKEALRDTVLGGTGKKASVDGYIISGKTGTAEKRDTVDVLNDYVLSFIGFAPFDDPQLVCYVIVDTPDVPDCDSSAYASVLFSKIMSEVLPYYNIMPDADENIKQTLDNNKTADEGAAFTG